MFLCGAHQFSGDVASGLLDALPRVLTLSPAVDEPLRDVLTLLSRELTNVEPGQQTVLDRLLDVLLVVALRSDFRRSATAPRWYRASADPRLQAALQAMHEDAGHPWTVPELAAISGLSRAAFARVFRDALGQAPLQYLTEWRTTLARNHLCTGELSLARIAAVVGYGSPYAFAAAFRRHHGIPSGAWRQQHSTGSLTLNGAEDTAPRAEPDESRLNGGFGDIDAAQVRSSLLRLPAMGGFYRHVNRFLENAVCATRNSSATQITASAIRLAVVMCSRTRIPGFSNGRMRQWQTPGLPSVM